jgi:membrane protein, antimicrobial resistance system
MDEQHTPTEQVKPMSLMERLTNVFAAPGELYENVRLTPKTTSNWLVPWIIFAVVAIIMGQVMVSNPSLTDQLGTVIRQKLEKQVQEGKMPSEQAERAFEFTGPGSMFFTITRIAGSVVGPLIALFVLGLIYWVLGKSVMKAPSPYMKVVEVVGLTFLIGALEQIVTTLLMFLFDSIFASPSLALFVSNFDLENKLHVILSKINIFTFWSMAVLSIGLSKLFQRDFPKVLVLILVLWVIWVVVSIFTGIQLG